MSAGPEKRWSQSVDLHFNERVKDLDKFVNVDRLKKELAKNTTFSMIWKIKVKHFVGKWKTEH